MSTPRVVEIVTSDDRFGRGERRREGRMEGRKKGGRGVRREVDGREGEGREVGRCKGWKYAGGTRVKGRSDTPELNPKT